MKSAKTLVLLLLVAASLTLGGLAWSQYRELIGLRAAALNANERSELQKRIWALEKSNRELSDRLAAQTSETPELEPVADAGAEKAADGPPRERGGRGRGNNGGQFSAWREAMAKPEVQAALNVQRKIGIEQRYTALFKNLNLTPEQAEKLKTLLAERQTTMQDILMVAREQGINPRSDPDSIKKLIGDAQNEINQNIKSVIGDSGFTELQTYEHTLPQRAVVNDLQQRLSYSDTPLNPAQSEQLVQILAANTPTRSRGGDAGTSGVRADVTALAGAFMNAGGNVGRGMNTPITSAAINQAQGVLSQPQVEALRQMQEQQQAQQQIQQLMRNAMQPPSGPPAAGANASSPATNRRKSGGG